MDNNQQIRKRSENIGVQKTVFFVRHGESESNIAPVFQDPSSPLSALGHEQAALIAGRSSRLSFESLISSPFERAKETAEYIARATGKPIEFSELFVERIKPSRLNGMPHSDESANKLWREWEESLHTPGLRVEDGENYDDQVARADSALAYLLARPEESILVVTHGYFLRTMLARVLFGDHVSPAAFQHLHQSANMKNTGITVFRYQNAFGEDSRWRLWIYNDHAHLG